MLLQVFLYDGAMRGFKVVGLGDGYIPGDILAIPVGTPLHTAPRQTEVFNGGGGTESHNFAESRADVMLVDKNLASELSFGSFIPGTADKNDSGAGVSFTAPLHLTMGGGGTGTCSYQVTGGGGFGTGHVVQSSIVLNDVTPATGYSVGDQVTIITSAAGSAGTDDTEFTLTASEVTSRIGGQITYAGGLHPSLPVASSPIGVYASAKKISSYQQAFSASRIARSVSASICSNRNTSSR